MLLVIAVLLPILAYVSETQTDFFSRDLQVGEFVASGDSYSANVTDSGVLVADLYLRIEPSYANLSSHQMVFSIWHDGDTHLDSMTLRFSTEPYAKIYLAAVSYDWPASRFTLDGLDAVFSVPKVGWYGVGTITLDFILDSYQYKGGNLGLTADFAMHKNAFLQLTSLRIDAQLYAQVPD